jgi:endonuclease/exonuclease/phosphatase family metal-dependent hydrolase
MKLISLNAWGGHEYEPLIAFLKEHARDTDIFCFQEMYSSPVSLISRDTRLNLFEQVSALLPDHAGYFAGIQDGRDNHGEIGVPATFGQAMFIRKNIQVESEGFVFAYRGRNTLRGNDYPTMGAGFQFAELALDGKKLTVASVHGQAFPADKKDTPERIEQSKKIKDFADNSEPVIVCGDFNLHPDTESIRILAEGRRDLIREFAISDTRGPVNRRKHPDDPQMFADYMFVPLDLKVNSFEVPTVEISDHLPMILEFEIS